MTAAVYGVGVGPGDPGLLTVRAVQILRTVDVVATPAAHGEAESLALEIARPHLPHGCAVEKLELPMTEDHETLRRARDAAALRLAAHARAGRSAAFITLGDSTLYSTWSYVADSLARLAPDVSVETVPGVTSLAACAVAAGQPLAAGREPLLIWPGPPPADASLLLQLAPNLVFMKAGRHLAGLASLAEQGGCLVTAVRRAGHSAAAVTRDLRAWAEDHDYFTTVLVRCGADGPAGGLGPARCRGADTARPGDDAGPETARPTGGPAATSDGRAVRDAAAGETDKGAQT